MYRAFDVNLVHEQYWSKFSKFYDYNDSIVCAMDTLRIHRGYTMKFLQPQ